MTKTRILKLILVTLVTLSLTCTILANAKSLYTIDSINANPTPISAWDIGVGGTFTYQATYSVPDWGWGAVGIAIDSDYGILFVTYEMSNIIQMLDATTMTDLGTTIAPGAVDLAGIAVDHDNSKVYTVDRGTNHLYIYDWNPSTKILTLVGGTYTSLTGIVSAYGIALDEANDILWIADMTTTVKGYSTSSWTMSDSGVISQAAMGIAIDVPNQIVYTGNLYGSGLLCKYDLATDTETTKDIGTFAGASSYENVGGIAVDQNTGYIYFTTGYSSDQLIVVDPSLTWQQSHNFNGDPTGLCIPTEDVSYNPLGLLKVDGTASGSVSPGNQITYTISYDNAGNPSPVGNVVIVDNLSPDTTFVSASGGGTYDSGDHKVTWNIGTVAAGASGSVTVVVQVKPGTAIGTTIDNAVTIDSDDTPPTTKHEYTDVVPGFVVPEIPLGTMMGLATMLFALVLGSKRPTLSYRK